MQIGSLAEELLFVTTYLQGKTPTGSVAETGFVFRVDLESGRNAPFLITNQHVLAGVTELKIRFVLADPTGENPKLGFATESTMTDFHARLEGPPRSRSRRSGLSARRSNQGAPGNRPKSFFSRHSSPRCA